MAPSGPVQAGRLDAGLAVLRGWGLEPVVYPHVRDVGEVPYLAGDDGGRASDVEEAWCDASIAAVLSARGGFGAQRIVELLDWERMARAGPKVFVGFSDATALHEAIAARMGLATLYGPMVAAEAFVTDAATQEHLRATLFAPESVQVLSPRTARTLVGGRAAGVTVGGCLTLLTTDLGTPSARSTVAGGILLLEDVAVDPYELDRGLTQLARAGLLKGVAATTHHQFFDSFSKEFPEIELRRGLRYVDSGRIATAGGLTSGIDLALHIVSRYFGVEAAQATAQYMEYTSEAWRA